MEIPPRVGDDNWLRIDFYDHGGLEPEAHWHAFSGNWFSTSPGRVMEDGSPALDLPTFKAYWFLGWTFYVHESLLDLP